MVMNLPTDDERSHQRAHLMDGRKLARRLRTELQIQIDTFRSRYDVRPCLVVMLVGEAADSVLYAQNIVTWSQSIGLGCSLVTMPEGAALDTVVSEVERISVDQTVNGLLIQMPLPAHLSAHTVFEALDPIKDVEGLHPENAGRLSVGKPRFVPTTPLAGLELLDAYGVDLAGKHAVILGRSGVVGKPLAQLLLSRDASVTVLHSRSRDLQEHVSRADIVAAAVGRPNLVTGAMLKPGATVLDFGINFVDNSVVGDVAFDEAREVAGMITPVPGGIGPLTNVMLARNVLLAANLQRGADTEDQRRETE